MSSLGRLPFGLMLGVSRRGYYLGSALLVVLLSAVYGLGLTVLQAIERATGGWGQGVHWHAFGHFFTTVTALALTGVLAAIAVTMGLGGFTTVRRVTI